MDHPTPYLTDTQLTRVIQSCGDFQQALSALEFLLEECDYAAKYSTAELRKFQCYENAAIVAFARPFEVSRGRTTLGLRAVGVRLTTTEEKLKGKLIGLRRKVVAHSDDESMHFKISTMQPFDDSPLAIPVLVFQESLRLDPAEVDELEALLRKLIHGLTVTIFAIAQSQPERINVYKLPGN
jgi:hypothetical protein